MDSKRTRNWASVIYPESAPENWKQIVNELIIPALISPLHDKDVNEDGTFKKPHYHIMILFEGVKTMEQAKEVFDSIGGVGVEPIKSTKAYARYLCHIDNPEKAQYSINDVESYFGVDYTTLISMASDKYSAIAEMIDFSMQNGIVSYAELLLYARKNRDDWFKVLCDNGTVTIVQFLKSKYWEETRNYGERGK